MNIDIKATDIELTEEIRDYVEKKIPLLDKYMDQDKEGVLFNVELAKTNRRQRNGDIFRAEIKVSGGGMDSYVDARSIDLYSAIDMALDDLSKEMNSKKGRKMKLVREGGRTIKYMMRGLKGRFNRKA